MIALRLTGRGMRVLGAPFRGAMLGIAALGTAVSATRVAQALLVARILGHVLRGHGGVAASLAAIGALTLARVMLLRARDRRTATAAARVRTTLRSDLYSRLIALGPGWLVRARTGALESVAVDGVDRLGDYYARFLPLALASIASVAAVLLWVAVLDPLTALVMVGCALLVPLAPVLTARAFGAAGRQFSEGLGRAAAEYLDAIQGLLTLKAFNASERWGHRLAAECEELSAEATSLGGLTTMHIGFVSLGMAGGTVLGVALATVRTAHHAVPGSSLLAILLLARECFRPLGELQAAFPAAYEAVAAANGVVDVLAATPAGPDPAQPETIDRRTLRAAVTFTDVTFSYGDHRAPALRDVTFDVSPGETVAVIGPSGAGKTTVLSLLLRFFDPQEGVIRIGGHDIRNMSVRDLRSLVAASFQDPYLFNRTIRRNLLLARPDATAAEVEAAARATNAHGFITALPDGYDTIIGERGTRLSGGERQRIAIARALLTDAPILVLDEPTSSVDAASEALIGDAIGGLTAARTTIIIAHRLSTVRRADRVIVLDAGRIVQVGAPDDLRQVTGAFARFVASQDVSS